LIVATGQWLSGFHPGEYRLVDTIKLSVIFATNEIIPVVAGSHCLAFDSGGFVHAQGASMFDQFIPVLMVLGVAMGFAGLFLGLSFWLGPKRPTLLKGTTYECGIPVRGSTQIRFFVRFFLVALFFLLFDLEAVFIYPWVILYKGMLADGQAMFALAEMGAFMLVLMVGFVYIWKKGGLEWQ
jgi:NADH-quinone oxidoreductase subunit A